MVGCIWLTLGIAPVCTMNFAKACVDLLFMVTTFIESCLLFFFGSFHFVLIFVCITCYVVLFLLNNTK